MQLEASMGKVEVEKDAPVIEKGRGYIVALGRLYWFLIPPIT